MKNTRPATSGIEDLDKWLNNVVGKGAIAVVCGSNGDMDTIGSAISLAAAFPQAMACGIGVSKIARRMIGITKAPFLQLSPDNPVWPKKLAGIVCVDAAAPSQLGLQLPDVPIAVIDHHDTNGWELKDGDLFLHEESSATTQIIHTYLNEFHPQVLTSEVCKLLLAGLITDTGRFKHADSDAFKSASEIISRGGIDYPHFLDNFEKDTFSDSERGAMVAGMQRMQSRTAGDWYLMHTKVGSNEGRMCNVLLSSGAEVALVARTRDGNTRLTSRAPRTSTAKGVHLGRIMESLMEKIGGEGGGHDGAAGWSGNSDRITAESAFIHALSGIKKGE